MHDSDDDNRTTSSLLRPRPQIKPSRRWPDGQMSGEKCRSYLAERPISMRTTARTPLGNEHLARGQHGIGLQKMCVRPAELCRTLKMISSGTVRTVLARAGPGKRVRKVRRMSRRVVGGPWSG